MTDTIPPRTTAWLDQEDAHVADIIRRYGVFIQMVGGGGCSYPGCCGDSSERPFAYTVGLFGIAHPELVVVGLDAPTAGRVLNAAADIVLDGGRLLPGESIAVARWDRGVIVEECPNPGDILFSANRHYQRPSEASVPALQLTFSDVRGRFPADPTYTGSRRRQPRPGEWSARD